jgi:hypothetical protein
MDLSYISIFFPVYISSQNYSKRNVFWTSTLSCQGNTGLTGMHDRSDRSNRTVILLPLHGLNSETSSLLSLHRHLFPPSTVPLLLMRPRRPPLAIWSSNQGRRVSSWGFGAHHRPDRSPKAVLRFPLKDSALKVPNGLFFIDLSI